MKISPVELLILLEIIFLKILHKFVCISYILIYKKYNFILIFTLSFKCCFRKVITYPYFMFHNVVLENSNNLSLLYVSNVVLESSITYLYIIFQMLFLESSSNLSLLYVSNVIFRKW